jgi:hypothetical protein
MSKKHMKKMFTIPGHKGNANQNHTKIPPKTNAEILDMGHTLCGGTGKGKET